MLLKRKTDHIVYAVPDLEVAMSKFENLTGINPVFGGYHTTQGTKNAIVNLGNNCYLEILAVDQNNMAIGAPRWMGIDLIETAQITRWSLKSSDLKRDSMVLKKYDPKMGRIQGGQRKTGTGASLSWEMIMPTPTPRVEIMPFMTDWQNSDIHPTNQLPEQGELIALELRHPRPQNLAPFFEQLAIDLDIILADKIAISAKIKSPKGIVRI